MEIGELIKTKRKEKHLSLEKLGELVGVSKVAVSKWEKGNIKNMRRDKIYKLSTILDIPIMTLLGYDEKEGAFIEKMVLDEKLEDDFIILTAEEFYNEVISMMSKTEDLTEEKKEWIKSTLGVACNVKEDK